MLLVTVQPHARFGRQGADLMTEAPAPMTDAVLGGEVAVQTLKGHVALTIPPESQNGNVFRLKGQGMPHLANPDRRGDLLVKIRVTLPTGLSEQEKALFRELRASREEAGVGKSRGRRPRSGGKSGWAAGYRSDETRQHYGSFPISGPLSQFGRPPLCHQRRGQDRWCACPDSPLLRADGVDSPVPYAGQRPPVLRPRTWSGPGASRR